MRRYSFLALFSFVLIANTQAAFACVVPSQAEAIKLVFTAWGDGALSTEEAEGLNRGRHCQIDTSADGIVTEDEFVAISLSDFDRADRNKDGTLAGRQEIGALADPGSPLQAGLTRQQAQDLAKIRFAVLDRQPRDGSLPVDEYLSITSEEFARNDKNGDGSLTGQEALRQQPAQ